jgi:WD40 repeat protein/serine/threonine protein kinase
MTACPPREQLEALLDETLPGTEQAELNDHVAACPDCQRCLELLTDTSNSLGGPRSVRLRGMETAEALPAFLDQFRESEPEELARQRGGELPDVAGYEILGEVGRGGCGVVYRARHLGLKRVVAVKMILAGAHAGPRDDARFRTEAEAVARLLHPNIVQVFDIGEAGGRPFLALEFVEGGSLVQHIRGTPQPIRPSARLIEMLARAVHFAHERGIVHRDIKPANVLLALSPSFSRGSENRAASARFSEPRLNEESELGARGIIPKLTDFGLAKKLDGPADATRTGEMVGTPSYMAPEQARGRGRGVGPATDVYALGAVLYELLTGRPPFKGATALDTVLQVLHEEPIRPVRLRPDLPLDLENVCLKCLDKDPGKRYASAAALADDLRRFRRGEAVRARPVGALARSWKLARRRPLASSLLVTSLLAGLIAFAGVTWAWRTTSRDREQARTSLYNSRITRSQLHWRLNDLAAARRSLRRSLADFTPESGRHDPRGWEWYYLEGLYNSELLTVRLRSERSEGRRGGLVFHHQGLWFASLVAGGGELTTWNRDGKMVHQVGVPDNAARLAIRPDGAHLALGEIEGVVSVRVPRSSRVVWSRRLHKGMVASLAYSPDSKLLATAGWDGTVHIVDADSGTTREILPVAPGGRVHAVAFRPDVRPEGRPRRAQYLVTGDDQPDDGDLRADQHTYRIRIWYNSEGKYQLWGENKDGHKSEVYGVLFSPDLFSPDRQRLATAGANGNIRIWELRKSRPADTGSLPLKLLPVQSVTGHAGSVLGMDFSPDGRYLAYGGSDGTARVWSVESGIEQIIFRCHTGPVDVVRFSPDGCSLATCCPESGRVKLWDLTRHPEYATLARTCMAASEVPVWDLLRSEGPRVARTGPDIEALCFTQDGKLVSVTVGGTLQSWDAQSGVLLDEQSLPLAAELITPARLADFAPGGRFLAGRARDDRRLVSIWDVESGQEVRMLKEHRHPVFVVRFSPDGKFLASCACDRTSSGMPHEGLIWNVHSGKLVGRFQGKGQIYSLAFSPDGSQLAAGCAEGRVWVLDWKRGKKLLDVAEHEGEVTAVAISPDGKQLASVGHKDHTLRLWDLASRKLLAKLEAPEMICSLVYSPAPKGNRLAGISRDSVRLWDVQAHQEALTLRGAPQRHWDPPFNPRLAYSPDGTRLAGTNWDESISVWEAEVWEAEPGRDEHRDRREKSRRRAAEARAAFWHLQEAAHCLKVKNPAAARFHLDQTAEAELSEPLKKRREMLANKLAAVPPR